MAFYRINTNGMEQLIDNNGNFLIADVNQSPLPPVIPQWLKNIIRIRLIISDPIASDIYLIDTELPESGKKGIVYIQCNSFYNGNYYQWNGSEWVEIEIVFADSYLKDLLSQINDVFNVANYLLNQMLLRINEVYRITSESDGGQSMSFSSLGELSAFLKEKLLALSNMNKEITGGQSFKKHKQTIGYIEDNKWD